MFQDDELADLISLRDGIEALALQMLQTGAPPWAQYEIERLHEACEKLLTNERFKLATRKPGAISR